MNNEPKNDRTNTSCNLHPVTSQICI